MPSVPGAAGPQRRSGDAAGENARSPLRSVPVSPPARSSVAKAAGRVWGPHRGAWVGRGRGCPSPESRLWKPAARRENKVGLPLPNSLAVNAVLEML